MCRPPRVSDGETRGRAPWPRWPHGAPEHAADEGGVPAPAGVTGHQPRPGGGGGRLGQGLAGLRPKIQLFMIISKSI